MPQSRKYLLWALVLLIPVFYWRGTEYLYERSATPTGVTDVAGYWRRFGAPESVRVGKRRDGDIAYYILTGKLPPAWSLATASVPPVYVFDGKGKFLDWCFDPSEEDNWMEQWDYTETEREDAGVLREQFVAAGK